MSELLVNTIKKADGTGSLSVPAESGTVVTTASPSLGRRRLTINGDMRIAQRGTSNTGQTASGYFTCDRWRWSVSSLGTWTTRQSTDAPDGFANSLNAECTTADASPAANDSLFLYHAFEGADLQQLGYGTANAQSITISFWIKATKTGAFQVNWKNNSATRLISSVQTVNSANTWEYKTITFVGYTGGAITNNNNKQAQLEMWFDAGSNFRINPTDTSWAAINNGYSQAYGTNINLGDTVGNQVYITGVQLEVGSVATPFEHRSYGEELALCQRYLQIFGDGYMAANGVGSSALNFGAPLTTPLRASPTIPDTGYLTHRSGNVNHATNGVIVAQYDAGTNLISLRETGASVTDEVMYVITIVNTLRLEAEL